MSSINLNQLFPELNRKQPNRFTQEDLQSMSYFSEMSKFDRMSQKQISNAIKKSRKHFNVLSLKKGTVIQIMGSFAHSGYIICQGEVKMLIKKNSRQKLDTFPKHVLHSSQQKILYLHQQFGIPTNKCQHLLKQFYEEQLVFKYIEYKNMYGEGHFGFGDMLKGSNVSFTAIATRDTTLLQISKCNFEAHGLKEYQIRKQSLLLERLMSNSLKSQFLKEILVKMSQHFNNFIVERYDINEYIYKQGQYPKAMYYVMFGEIQLKKAIQIKLPQKVMKDQNRPVPLKQMSVKVSRVAQNSYFGESQIFLNSRKREFSAYSLQNNTIILRLQPNSFMKAISQFRTFQNELANSAKQKLFLANQNYLKQKSKVTKVLSHEVDSIENKKKQKIISNLLFVKEDAQVGQKTEQSTTQINNRKSKALEQDDKFRTFTKDGVLYRDSYEKLELFNKNQERLNRKNGSRQPFKMHKAANIYKPNSNKINQYRNQHRHSSSDLTVQEKAQEQQSSSEKKYHDSQSRSPPLKKTTKQSRQTPRIVEQQKNRSPSATVNSKAADSSSNKERLLFSPRKDISILEFMGPDSHALNQNYRNFMTPEMRTKTNSYTNQDQEIHSASIGRKRSLKQKNKPKFQDLQKDQAVFKRVLIKNGKFNQSQKIFKGNNNKAIIHNKFDTIIKECMQRKGYLPKKLLQSHPTLSPSLPACASSQLKRRQMLEQIIKDNYQTAVQQIKQQQQAQFLQQKQLAEDSTINRAHNNMSISKFSLCKGIDKLRKDIQSHQKSVCSRSLTPRISSRVKKTATGSMWSTTSKVSAWKNRKSTALRSNRDKIEGQEKDQSTSDNEFPNKKLRGEQTAPTKTEQNNKRTILTQRFKKNIQQLQAKNDCSDEKTDQDIIQSIRVINSPETLTRKNSQNHQLQTISKNQQAQLQKSNTVDNFRQKFTANGCLQIVSLEPSDSVISKSGYSGNGLRSTQQTSQFFKSHLSNGTHPKCQMLSTVNLKQAVMPNFKTQQKTKFNKSKSKPNQSSKKFILLNHMMKPITYCSSSADG